MASLLYQIQQRTVASFFNRKTANHLWKSVTSVSKHGKLKGRGNAVPRAVNLNKGQLPGFGKVAMVWPGLNSPSALRDQALEPRLIKPDSKHRQKLDEMRDEAGKKRRMGLKLHPLERGWSGAKLPGRVLSAPESVEDECTYEGFTTVCLEMKRVMRMTTGGRTPRMSAFVITGNANGTIGWGLAKAIENRAALRKALARASRQLIFVELYQGHTVYQDFYAECVGTKLFVQRKPKGHGLRCHRCIKSICEVVGIKDIHVKVEGSTSNYQAITKAFLCGLVYQETYQQLAERKRLHVVEMRPETGYIPTVVASPKQNSVRTAEELQPNEILDVKELYSEGRYPLKKPAPPIPYATSTSNVNYKYLNFPFRNMEDVKIQLIADGRIPYFSDKDKNDWFINEHQKVLDGKSKIPKGIGLTSVNRESLLDEQE